MIPGRKYTPEILVAIAWRRKWLIVLPAVVVACGVAMWSHQLPNVYESQVVIHAEPPRITEGFARSGGRAADRLQAAYQRVISRPQLEQIILELDLYPEARDAATMDSLINATRSKIALRNAGRDTFRLTYTGDDPRQVMQVVERLSAMFIDQSLRDREVLAEGTSEFLEAQVEDTRRRLVGTEARLGQFIRQHDGELPAQLDGNSQGLRSAETRLQALNESINRDRDRRLFVERQLADSAVEALALGAAPTVPQQAVEKPGPAAQRLHAAREELRALELRLQPEHPNIVRLKRTIVELQEQADLEAAEGGSTASSPQNPAEARLRNRQAELQMELEKLDRDIAEKLEDETLLQQAIADYQRRIEATPKREAEMKELTRDYDTLQGLYKGLLSKKEDSQIAANVERRQIGEQFRIVEPATLPQTPISPNRLRLNLIGLIGGLLCGLGLVALLEYLDRTLASEADVIGALNVPVLGTIPLLGGRPDTDRRRWVKVVSALGVVALVFAAAVAWRLLR